jgi:hypothetical protein
VPPAKQLGTVEAADGRDGKGRDGIQSADQQAYGDTAMTCRKREITGGDLKRK